MKKQLFALALVTAAGCFLAGCSGIAVITGNGIITEKTFDPGDISRLTTAGYWKITLDPNADRNQCTIVIDENLLEELAIKSGSGRLQVTPLHNLRPSREPQLRLQLKQMPEKLNFSGISNLEVTGKITRKTEWSFSRKFSFRQAASPGSPSAEMSKKPPSAPPAARNSLSTATSGNFISNRAAVPAPPSGTVKPPGK